MKYFIRFHDREKDRWKELRYWSKSKAIIMASKMSKMDVIDYVEYGNTYDDDWIGFWVEAVVKNEWSVDHDKLKR